MACEYKELVVHEIKQSLGYDLSDAVIEQIADKIIKYLSENRAFIDNMPVSKKIDIIRKITAGVLKGETVHFDFSTGESLTKDSELETAIHEIIAREKQIGDQGEEFKLVDDVLDTAIGADEFFISPDELLIEMVKNRETLYDKYQKIITEKGRTPIKELLQDLNQLRKELIRSASNETNPAIAEELTIAARRVSTLFLRTLQAEQVETLLSELNATIDVFENKWVNERGRETNLRRVYGQYKTMEMLTKTVEKYMSGVASDKSLFTQHLYDQYGILRGRMEKMRNQLFEDLRAKIVSLAKKNHGVDLSDPNLQGLDTVFKMDMLDKEFSALMTVNDPLAQTVGLSLQNASKAYRKEMAEFSKELDQFGDLKNEDLKPIIEETEVAYKRNGKLVKQKLATGMVRHFYNFDYYRDVTALQKLSKQYDLSKKMDNDVRMKSLSTTFNKHLRNMEKSGIELIDVRKYQGKTVKEIAEMLPDYVVEKELLAKEIKRKLDNLRSLSEYRAQTINNKVELKFGELVDKAYRGDIRDEFEVAAIEREIMRIINTEIFKKVYKDKEYTQEQFLNDLREALKGREVIRTAEQLEEVTDYLLEKYYVNPEEVLINYKYVGIDGVEADLRFTVFAVKKGSKYHNQQWDRIKEKVKQGGGSKIDKFNVWYVEKMIEFKDKLPFVVENSFMFGSIQTLNRDMLAELVDQGFLKDPTNPIYEIIRNIPGEAKIEEAVLPYSIDTLFSFSDVDLRIPIRHLTTNYVNVLTDIAAQQTINSYNVHKGRLYREVSLESVIRDYMESVKEVTGEYPSKETIEREFTKIEEGLIANMKAKGWKLERKRKGGRFIYEFSIAEHDAIDYYKLHSKLVNIAEGFDVLKSIGMIGKTVINFEYKSRVEDYVAAAKEIISQKSADKNTRALLDMIDHYMEFVFEGRKPPSDFSLASATARAAEKIGINEKNREKIRKLLSRMPEDPNSDAFKQWKKEAEKTTKTQDFVGKFFNNFLGYVSFLGLGWNFRGALVNFAFGISQNYQWALGGVDFTTKEFTQAGKMLIKYGFVKTPFPFVEGKSEFTKKIDRLLEIYGINTTWSKVFTKGTVFEKITEKTSKLGLLAPMGGYEIGERFIKAQLLLAYMLHQKVKVGKKEMRLWDIYDSDGNIKYADIEADFNHKGIDNEFTKHRNRLTVIIMKNHGNYDADEMVRAKRTVMGRALLMFKNWVWESYKERWQDEHYEVALGRKYIGRYKAFATLIRDIGWTKSFGNLALSVVDKNAMARLSDKAHFQEALRKLSGEVRLAVGMGVIVLILTIALRQAMGAADSDEDRKHIQQLRLWLNMSKRMYQDLTFFWNPLSAYKIMKSPVPFTNTLDDITNLTGKTFQAIYDPNFEWDRWWHTVGRLTPGINQYIKYQNSMKMLYD